MPLRLLRLTLAALLALSLLPSPPAVQAQEPGGPEYVVQAGDTLYEIARRFGTTVPALQQANEITDPGALAVGQHLLIPGYEGLSGILTTHSLEPGESLASLSLRFGVSMETLVILNRVVNPARTYAGQSVILPEGGDGSLAVPGGRVMVVSPRSTLLGLAAETGGHPWELRIVNQQAAGWLPGSTVVVPGDAGPITALPEPVLALRVHPLPPVQGKTVSIGVQLAAPAEVAGTLGEWPLHFQQEGEWQFALQGLHALADPDLYPLRLQIRPQSGPTVIFEQSVPMRDGAYGYDPPLVVDPSVIDPAVVLPEFEQVQALMSKITETRYWDGAFLLPSTGPLVSFFGSRRSYNGGPYDSFHTGADFRGGIGMPVLAPAPGVIVFAGPLAVRGNATIIDHGWGVLSGYWHQSEIQVEVGQTVQAGDQIGLVGATGRVTGPHLHWEMWVGGVQVDPLVWTEMSFP